jgi:transcriptional regulator with XRE-family HTH domain
VAAPAYNALQMPAASELTSVIDRQLLLQLGARLKRARVTQGLNTTEMAQRAGISRMTLSAIEAGEPTPTMGSYLRVMSVLQMSKDLVLLASDTLEPPGAEQGENAPASGGLVVSASNAKHELQDLQSLMLHQEAVRLMQKKPELVQQALDTLERWRQSGDSHSRFLWDEWSVILHRRAWRRALSHTKRSKELRQASPLTTILPPETRQRILDEVRRLKSGVPLGSISASKQRPSKGSPSGT